MMRIIIISISLSIIGLQQVENARITVTNEDIRDAILQVVTAVRTFDDKLERHEFRERSLGDQLKKALIAIDKRIKLLDQLKGTVSRLDERLAAVETALLQKDGTEKLQLEKTSQTVEDIRQHLPAIVDKLKTDIIDQINGIQNGPNRIIKMNDLNQFEDSIEERLNTVNIILESIKLDLNQIKNDSKNMMDTANKSTDNFDKVKRQLDTSEQLLDKYENKLAEYNNRIPNMSPNDDEEQKNWRTNLMKTMEIEKNLMEQLLSDIQGISGALHQLPTRIDLESAQNLTTDRVSRLAGCVDAQPDDNGTRLQMIDEKLTKNHEELTQQIKSLLKLDQMLVQTADGVLDTKRRVEYGIHQIIGETGQLVKAVTQDVGTAMGDRFDLFEMSILDEENGALANLTHHITRELDRVWRQIGVMHQQMSINAETLTHLQNQTDVYVNGSLNAMGSMRGKVGKITNRIVEVDENLNFLLGKLSLVTQEFNGIKSGLVKALDEMRATFRSVNGKVQEPNAKSTDE